MNVRLFPIVLMVLSCVCAASAQDNENENASDKPNQRENRYGRMYNQQTTETFSGEVTKIEHAKSGEGMRGRGIHLTVKTDSKSVQVALGPDWFIENQDIQIKPNDEVEVTGSRVTSGEQPVVIAKEVRKGNEVLRLRDESGRPMWMAWSGSNESGGRMMGHHMMGGRHGRASEMMQDRERMFSEMKSAQEKLDKKVEQMNSAMGEEKLDAMASVINEMARERDAMFNHMIAMHERMTHMREMGPRPGSREEHEPAGAAPNGSEEPQDEQER